MNNQYLRYSGPEFHPMFALFSDNLTAIEVHVAVTKMVEASGEAWQDKVTGEYQWNEKDSYRSLLSDADPEDDSAPHDGEFITAAVKMYKRVRFILMGQEVVVLTRHPIDNKTIRTDYLEDNNIFYGTAEIELSDNEEINRFSVTQIDIEHDPDTQLPPMVQELQLRIEEILNTGT